MPKDRCINNNNLRTPNGNQPNIFVSNATVMPTIATIQAKGQQQQQPQQQQHQSNSTTYPTAEDGNVLKKVISFTLDQMKNAEKSTTRPAFVPEKLHFSAYEQFKGKSTICAWTYTCIYKYCEFVLLSCESHYFICDQWLFDTFFSTLKLRAYLSMKWTAEIVVRFSIL